MGDAADPKARNINQETSPFTAGVPRGTELNLVGIFPGRNCCRLIENCNRGKIEYVNADGNRIMLHDDFDLPTAIRPIEAQKILAGTTADLVVYF